MQGLAPQAEYRFKHALIQDAAYENLLKSRRQLLHGRIGEVLRDQFAASAAAEPEVLAHHFSQAGFTEAAVEWWGKAGQLSLERSALAEATAQLTRALDQIVSLPGTLERRREELKLQVALINAVMHVKGYAAPETKAAIERARFLIERAEALGETPEDPLIFFSALYGLMSANVVAFNGDMVRQQAADFLALAEKEKTTAPLLMANRFMGLALLYTGEPIRGLTHLEKAISLYNPAEHRRLAMQFGQDAGVHASSYRAWALWLLGHPERALTQCAHAVSAAREIGQAATLMNTLALTSFTYILCGTYAAAEMQANELAEMAQQRRLLYWDAFAQWVGGWLLSIADKPSEAVQMLSSGIAAWRSTGATLFAPTQLSCLAASHAKLGQYDDAQRIIVEAKTTAEKSKEIWFEAEVDRIAGEIALLDPQSDLARGEVCFERALAVARQQQAKSWELRASMSLARLWRDQGKVPQARELLAPVYGWFTEGFDTRDLKEAKALLEQLAI